MASAAKNRPSSGARRKAAGPARGAAASRARRKSGAGARATGRRTAAGGKTAKRGAGKAARTRVAKKRPPGKTAATRTARKSAPAKTGRLKTAVKKKALRRPPARRMAASPSRVSARIMDLEAELKRIKAELQLAHTEKAHADRRYRETAARLEQMEAERVTGPEDRETEWSADDVLDHGTDDLDESVADVARLLRDPPASQSAVSDPSGAAPSSYDGESAVESERPTADAHLSYEQYDEDEAFLNPASDAATAERRRELDRERADRELELGDEPFWMVCPRCGEYLNEHEFDNIKVERCENCGAVAIDKNEIELLVSAEEDRMISYRTKGLLQ